MQASDIDLWEINEAFAAVPLKTMRDLDLDPERVNVNGGAIALGHPIGATGAMLIGTVLDELERRDLTTGLVTMCTGGGMGTATIDRAGVTCRAPSSSNTPSDGVTVVRLNRPERLNAINEVLLGGAPRDARRHSPDDARRRASWCSPAPGAASAPASTCATSAPSMLDADDPASDRLRFQEAMASLPQAIRALPQPVVAAVNGPAVGGGLALCARRRRPHLQPLGVVRQRRDRHRSLRRRDGHELLPAPHRGHERRRRVDAHRPHGRRRRGPALRPGESR